jgi:hypothetical protein
VKRQSLGHQFLGDYHYFTVFPETAASLAQSTDESFRNHEDFLGLVTAVHESYHVFQSLVLGAGASVVTAEDTFIASVLDNGSALESTETQYRAYVVATYLRQLYYSPDPAKWLYDHEAKLNPRSSLGELPAFATCDLLECHAALLTEMYISNHRAYHPENYDPEKDEDLEGSFRVELMEKYNRPWALFRKVLEPILGFDRWVAPRDAHPFHRQCPRAMEYTLLTFLLEYALHVPPPPSESIDRSIDRSNRAVYWEDYNPAVRFSKLLYALRLDVIHFGTFNFEELYSTMALRLAKWIDINNLLAVSENIGTPVNSQPRAQDIFLLDRQEVLKKLGLSFVPISFPSFSDTTEQWLHVYRNVETEFYRLSATRLTAMSLRWQQPDVFRVWSPKDFFSEIGMPQFFETPTGINVAPGCTIEKRIHRSKLNLHDPTLRRFGIIGLAETADEDVIVLRCQPAPANIFLEQMTAREILLKISESRVNSTPMPCPLAVGRLAACDCSARSEKCGQLNVPRDLPLTQCAARNVYNTYFEKAAPS